MQRRGTASVRPWPNVLLLGDATDSSHAPLNLVSAPTLYLFHKTPFHCHLPGGHLPVFHFLRGPEGKTRALLTMQCWPAPGKSSKTSYQKGMGMGTNKVCLGLELQAPPGAPSQGTAP